MLFLDAIFGNHALFRPAQTTDTYRYNKRPASHGISTRSDLAISITCPSRRHASSLQMNPREVALN